MAVLKRFTCKNKCSKSDNCKKMALEIHNNSNDKNVDIMIISEFPGKQESEEQKYLSNSSFGNLFRNVIDRLSSQYSFSYAISGMTKAQHNIETARQNFEDIKHCAKEVLRKEIEYVNPKVIVILGDIAYRIFHNQPLPFGQYVEDGRMEKIKVYGEKREVMFAIHPVIFNKGTDPCAIGLLYENLRKAIVFATKGRDYRIPQNFDTNLITKMSEVKSVLKDLRNTRDYCCIDTEGPNLNRIYDTNNLSIQFCADGKVGHVIPLDHYESPFRKKLPDIYNLIKEYFTLKTKNTGYLWVNAKFDYHKIFREIKTFSLNASNIDVSFAEFSLEENLTRIHGYPKYKGAFSLFTMAYKRGYNYYRDTDGKEKRDRLAYLPLSEWAEYGGADVVCPWHIYQSQLKVAKDTGYYKDFKKLNEIFFNHLNRITTYVEHCGLSINYEVVEQLCKKTGALNLAIDDVINRFYNLKTVQKTNERLVKEELGVTACGLFGTTELWNPSKPKHRDKLYFETLELEPIDEDDDSSTTGRAFQDSYQGIPEVDLLREYNALSKLQSSFVNPLYKQMRKTSPDVRADLITDYRARCSFLNDAVTGRLKSINPNTQQRPTHGKFAKQILGMYEPPKGRIVIKLDYSTFEVRGLGFISKDKSMIDSFVEMNKLKNKFRKNPKIFAKEGYDVAIDLLKAQKIELKAKKIDFEDFKDSISEKKRKSRYKKLQQEIKKYKNDLKEVKERYKTNPISFSKAFLEFLTDFHRRSASLFNKVDISKVTKEQRQGAKNLVFGSIYGRTVASIAKVLGVDESVAQEYYEAFMNAMPSAVAWLNKMKKLGRKNFYVTSPLGRRRRLWGHFHNHKGIKNKMDRLAMNTIIQGVCSDLNLVASSLLISFIEAHGKAKYQISDEGAWFLTNLVHDCTEMEIPIEDIIYFVTNIEKLFTSYLQHYIKKVFKFNIEIPIEVDFTIGINYADYTDWNGSKEHLYEISKDLLNKVNNRDWTRIKFSELTKNPLFDKYNKDEIAKQVTKNFVKIDLQRAV